MIASIFMSILIVCIALLYDSTIILWLILPLYLFALIRYIGLKDRISKLETNFDTISKAIDANIYTWSEQVKVNENFQNMFKTIIEIAKSEDKDE